MPRRRVCTRVSNRIRLAMPDQQAPLRMRMPGFTPAWQGPFENWCKRFVQFNYWRVQNYIPTEEDALQECGVVFAKCLDRYGKTVTNPAWFMSLFSKSVVNTWHTLAVYDRKQRELLEFVPFVERSDNDWNYGPFLIKLAEAPPALANVLDTIMHVPNDILDFVFPPNLDMRKPSARRREQVNNRLRELCELSGDYVDQHADILGQINELMQPG
jgi:hypothetical protein